MSDGCASRDETFAGRWAGSRALGKEDIAGGGVRRGAGSTSSSSESSTASLGGFFSAFELSRFSSDSNKVTLSES